MGLSQRVKQTVCGLDAAGTGGNVSLAGTGHRCKTQEVILGNHRPFGGEDVKVSWVLALHQKYMADRL